jgi:hypothetical protein
MRSTSFTPDVLRDTVYLHLSPQGYNDTLRGVNIRKSAKSPDAQVMPGDVVVKLIVSVPKEFFEDAMPTAEVELDASQVIAVGVIQGDAPSDDESFVAGELNG